MNKRLGQNPTDWDDYLQRWIAMSYIAFLIIIPIIAILSESLENGLLPLWSSLMTPQALYSLKLTFMTAFFMVIINVVTGTATAWVLVRYQFPFKNLMNALIDLPFAIPTVVTGIMLVALYGPSSYIGAFLEKKGMEVIFAKPGIILALLYVSFPFVVRAVQPVLLEMDRDMEEAAQTLGARPGWVFLKIVLPTLRPAILTGAALSFSRAIGEFGSVAIVSGNSPFKTQVASVFIYGEIESYNPQAAMGMSVVLLVCSFIFLIILNFLQVWSRKNEQTI